MVALRFVDVESCRLGTEHGSAVWELAIIAREDRAPDVEYLWQVRPNLTHAEAKSLQVGGYYERCKVADGPVGAGRILLHPKMPNKTGARQAQLIAHDVAKILDGALIVGANPWFDAGHIDAFLREHGQALSADYHMRDIGSLVAGYVAACEPHDWTGPGPAPDRAALRDGGKLTDAARAVGLDPGKYETHTALGDARLARDIWNVVFA